MRKARFAEWLLRSVTTPERAASTAGDLVESAPEHGEWWFWRSLLGTVGSQMWRGVATNPRAMLALAFRASLWILVYQFLYLHLYGGVFFIHFMMGRWIGRRAPGNELSAALALCILQGAISAILGIVEVHAHSPTHVVVDVLRGSAYALPCFAGALTVASSRSSKAGAAHA